MSRPQEYVNSALEKLGFELRRTKLHQFPREATTAEIAIINLVRPFTMTSVDRVWGALQSVRYVTANAIPGAIVECGVWRGGSVMAMAKQLNNLNSEPRDFYLYDTFSGMTAPSGVDIDRRADKLASDLMSQENPISNNGDNIWAVASLNQVKSNLAQIEYPQNRFNFVEGDVISTLNEVVPDQIAILRLDTDWYESTAKELDILYPKLVSGGICIIDDYGHFEGAKKAVDEFLADSDLHPLIHKLDYAGRMWIKA